MRKAAFALFVAVTASSFGAAAPADPVRLSLAWRATIDAQGHVTELVAAPDRRLDRLPQVRDSVAAAVRGWTFVPGQVGGRGAVTESELTVDVSLSAQADGSARVRIDAARTGARLDRRVAPRYPGDAVRRHLGGLAVVRIDYDANGKVTSAALDDDSPQVAATLAKAAIEAVRQWSFQTERVAGHGVAGQAVVPICFTVGTGPRCPQWTPRSGGDSLADGELLAIDPVLRLASDVAGSTL